MNGTQLWQSQNFLRSPEFVANLINKTDINSEDVVVEIGPGKGVITRQLAKKTKRVIAVELDHKLVSYLRTTLGDLANVEIQEADFLRWDLPQGEYKVFSNIPFNITADIVNRLLTASNPPLASYLIMQDRAAERFIGEPVGQNSQMSVLLQPFWDMGIVTRIDRKQFVPVPNINAVLARFIRREEPLIDVELAQYYRDFVIFGYNRAKATALDAFKKVFSSRQIDIISKTLGIAHAKPSGLSVDQWVALFNIFMQYTPIDRKSLIHGAERNLRSSQRGMEKQYRTRRK